MKITVDSKTLQSLLATVGQALPSNAIIPIMENYKIEVLQDRIQATATDSNTTIISYIENTALETFSFCVGGKLLTTLKSLPQQPLTLTYDYNKSTLTIKTRTGRYKLPTVDVTDFPDVKQFEGEAVTLTGEEAVNIFNLHNIASSDALRTNMNCIFFDATNNCVASTDAHKLLKVNVESLDKLSNSMLVHKDTCKKLLNLIKSTDTIELKASKNKASFKFGNTEVHSTLTDESYPSYNAVIPTETPIYTQIDKAALTGSLKRLIPYTSKMTSTIRFTFTENKLTITAEDLDYGNKAEESISVDYNYTNPFEIGFNAKFVLETVAQFNTDMLTIQFIDKSKPAKIEEDRPDNNKVGVLMPVMLNYA